MEDYTLAHRMAHKITDALNRRIEERFRAVLLLVNPALNMKSVKICSDLAVDNVLSIKGVSEVTIEKAMIIFDAAE